MRERESDQEEREEKIRARKREKIRARMRETGKQQRMREIESKKVKNERKLEKE